MDQRKKRDLSKKQQKFLSLGAIVLFFLFSLFLFAAIGVPMVKHARNPQEFRAWIDSMGVWGRVAFVGMNIFQVLVAVVPGGPLEVAGGYAFGHTEATVLCIIGMAVGNAVVFLLVRSFGYRLVEAFFPVEKIRELKFLSTAKKRNILLSILFLIPGTPKDLIAYFCGLTDIPFWTFIAISTLCRIPAVWGSAMGGNAAGEKSYTVAIVIMAAVVVSTVIGIGAYELVVKHNNKEKKESEENKEK